MQVFRKTQTARDNIWAACQEQSFAPYLQLVCYDILDKLQFSLHVSFCLIIMFS